MGQQCSKTRCCNTTSFTVPSTYGICKNHSDHEKVLLLGNMSAGKSTIFHQFCVLFDPDRQHSNIEYEDLENQQKIRQNCLVGMMTLLQMTLKIQQNNKENIHTGIGVNNKNVTIDPCHLEKIYQEYFAQFKEQLIDLVEFYSKQYICLTFDNEANNDMTMSYKNDDLNTIFIPDPAILINDNHDNNGKNRYRLIKYLIKHCHMIDNDTPYSFIGKINGSMTKLDPFIEKSNTIHGVSKQKIKTSTTLMSNFIQNIKTRNGIKNVTVHGNMDNMSDYCTGSAIGNQINIVLHPHTFVCVPMEIMDQIGNDEIYVESLMIDCLRRRYFLLIKEYFYKRNVYLASGYFRNECDVYNIDINPTGIGSIIARYIDDDKDLQFIQFNKYTRKPEKFVQFLREKGFGITEESVLVYHSMQAIIDGHAYRYGYWTTEQEEEFLLEKCKFKQNEPPDEPKFDISKYTVDEQDDTIISIQLLYEIRKSLMTLWQCDSIYNIWKSRHLYSFYFPENMDYYYNQRIGDIFEFGYCPTIKDKLKCAFRTHGLSTHNFNFSSNIFNVHDVGGAWHDRTRWIHSFDSVSCVLFVAGLNHYSQVLIEDSTTNSMIDSIKLFYEVFNSKWFKHTSMVLILNKDGMILCCNEFLVRF